MSGAVALLALACFGAPASVAPAPAPEAAAPVPQKGTGSPLHMTKLYELVVQYPSPIWASSPEAARRSHFSRDQKGPQFIIEQLPEQESPKDWTRLYAIYGLYLEDGRFESFKAFSLRKWTTLCGEEHLGIQPIVDASLHWQILVVCESTPHGLAAAGWGEGVGAIVLMDVQRLSDTYVRVHHTWRGERFEATDPSGWPVTQERIHEMRQRFSQIALSYKPDAQQSPDPNENFMPTS